MTTETTQTTTTTTAPVTNQEKTSALDQLVGPGKKFQTAEDLALGKLNADTFVEKLTQENRDLRNLVNQQDARVSKLETKISILDRLDGGDTTVTNNPDTTTTTPTTTTVTQGLSEGDALKLIERVKQNDVQAQNKAEVDAVLQSTLGDKAVAFVRQRANELGMKDADLHALALTSPKAFLAMLGISKTNAQGNPMYQPSSNNNAVQNPGAAVRNEVFYKTMQDKMGVKKFVLDKQVQRQMHMDMQTMGDSYFS